MSMVQSRRHFLTTLSGAGAVGLLRAPRALAAEEPLETTSVRLFKSSLICSAAPQYAAEELLRAEGFKEIAYIEATLDAGERVTLLAGVMVGCFELFAREGIGSIAELKGKSIGVQTAGSLSQQLVTLMAAGRARSREGRSLDHRSLDQADRIICRGKN